MNHIILHDHERNYWLCFAEPVEVITTTSLADVRDKLAQVEATVTHQGLHAAGFISYEAAPAFDPAFRTRPPASLPLLWFGLYRQPDIISLPPPKTTPAYSLGEWLSTVGPDAYQYAIGRIKDYIAKGDTYQVNYTIRLRADFSGEPWGLFLKLIQGRQGRYAAYVDIGSHVICSLSPELFFRRAGLQITARPMKGTATRGKTLIEDKAQIDWLKNSAKNRAENVMIVDMIRNDLGIIADLGTVRVPHLFEVERYPTLLQMTSTVTAQSDVSTADIIAALFPCASITGAPKVRTTEIIAELEREPRGIYTGAIGYIAPQRQAQFNVAIRTVTIDRGKNMAEYGTGGGIVWDSNAGDEYEESQLKAQILRQAPPPDFELLETILWEPASGYFLLDEHLQRLTGSGEYFNIPIDPAEIAARLAALSHSFSRDAHKVRLLVAQDGELTLQSAPLTGPTPKEPWRLGIAPQPVQSSNPFLYHKTTCRDIYNTARAARPNCDDVLLWNERGEITEACLTNVVVQFGSTLVTPPVECGLLPGTFRASLLAQNIIQERIVTLDDIRQVDRIYLINSVRKWIEVVLVK